tara:strand:- start:1028 stop:1696 length:669 start_codon:yes stop_codon:yes gene_type:complete
MAIGAVLGIAGSIAGGLIGGGAAKRAQRAAAKEARKLQAKLTQLENNRQAIVNPYVNVQNLSSMIQNPFDNLGVATKSAEIQMEQTDLALANTLDTIRATGASAGGATALAQAALKSKENIAASIEQQEVNNEKLRAQGEAQVAQMEMSEAQRVQQAKVSGDQFVFQTREQREMQQLDRVAGQLAAARAAAGQAAADRTSALTGMIGGIASIAGTPGAFKFD